MFSCSSRVLGFHGCKYYLRQSGELEGERTGCGNESPFMKSESVTCSVVSDSLRPMACARPGSSVHDILPPGENTGVGRPALLQGVFPNSLRGKPESTFSSVEGHVLP